MWEGEERIYVGWKREGARRGREGEEERETEGDWGKAYAMPRWGMNAHGGQYLRQEACQSATT
jgi:hypothetical protein